MTTEAGTRARIATPCIDVCVIDSDRGLCRGCRRTLDEITRWSRMSDAERARVMDELSGRGECGPEMAGQPD